MYGAGIYAHDSFFRVPIFKGTDLTILLVGVPMLAAATLLDLKSKTVKRRILLASVIALFLYYAANIAFGVTYNSLHLVYIALFSSSLFALIIAMSGMDYSEVEKSITNVLPYKGIYAFLAVTGIALFIAWLPDIISALMTSRPLAMIEVYTTEPTFVLDMGSRQPTGIHLSASPTQEGGAGIYASFDFADHLHGHGGDAACPNIFPNCGRNSDSPAGPHHKNRHFHGLGGICRIF